MPSRQRRGKSLSNRRSKSVISIVAAKMTKASQA
jgi:hypothetical protein